MILPRRWCLNRSTKPRSPAIAEQLKISPLLARILSLRGFTDSECGAALSFFEPALRSALAVRDGRYGTGGGAHRRARSQTNEQIGIWGDYDVDGTTGASVLVSFLREIGAAAGLPCAASHRRRLRPQYRRTEAAQRARRRSGGHGGLRHFQRQRSGGRATASVSTSSSSIITSRRTSCRRRWR